MAAKAARRRGRTAKQGVDRYPKGKIRPPSEKQQAEANMAVGIAARQRVYGLRPHEAKQPEAGHAIGRLVMGGKLATGQQARDMAEAAAFFHGRRVAADSAILSQRLGTTTDYTGHRGGGNGGDGDEPGYVEWANRARSKYAEVRRAILECGDPLAMCALEMAILEDREPKDDEMMGALRCGLNAVHRVMRYERRA